MDRACSITTPFYLRLLMFFILYASSISSDFSLSNARYNYCGRYVCQPGKKFLFAPENVYKYTYLLNSTSTFSNDSKRISNLQLEFEVEIKVKDCDGIMRVKRSKKYSRIAIFDIDSDEFEDFYNDVSKYSIKFSFYDGMILNVCPNSEDSVLSVNTKKGILSAFQNRMKRFDADLFISERDVNGVCPTNYNLYEINGTTLIIRKSKDISECTERYQLHSVIPTSKYIFQSKYHKWAPLSSTAECFQTIDHGILVNITCREDHRLKLFSNVSQSSRTTITQNLLLVSEDNDWNFFYNIHESELIGVRDDLSFDHKKPKKSEIDELSDSEAVLLQLCKTTLKEYKPDVATLFSKFIHTARHLSYKALKQLHGISQTLCPSGLKHVQDALPFLRSPSAISLMKDFMITGNVSSSTSDRWLLAMSLFPRPDEDVIMSVTQLLSKVEVTDKIILSVTTVIHSYCAWSSKCNLQEVITKPITRLEINLNETLGEEYTDIDRAIVLLKGLGNSGVVTETIKYTLASTIRNHQVPTSVRVVAVEAHRRLPCELNVEMLRDIYANYELDVTIRIAAYLQLMRCPSYGVLALIKKTLQTESINQVGSFVWSHLKNTIKSALPSAADIQAILQDYELKDKYHNWDLRKFSRSYETAFYSNDYGIGGFVIYDVIFSTKSYIPCSISANVTISLFGEIINVAEVRYNLEGLEMYIEPLIRSGASFTIDKLEDKFPSLRFLRSVTQSIRERIKDLPNDINYNFPEPLVSFSMRIFGNEMSYSSYRGEKEINQAIMNLNPYKLIKEILNGEEVKYDLSFVFLDISYVTPTAAGLAMNLDATGMAICNFDMAVFANASNFIKSHQLHIDGKLKPRFSLHFEGSMGTELVYAQTMIKVKTNAFTTSAVEGCVSINGYNNVTVSFNLPLDRYDLFDVKSDLVFKDNEKVKGDVIYKEKEKGLSSAEERVTCFWQLLDQAFSMKMCSSYWMPESGNLVKDPLLIFRGPFRFGLYSEKSENTVKLYVLKYLKSYIEPNISYTTIEYETPNASVTRVMKAVLWSQKESSNMTIDIRTNDTTLHAFGILKNNSLEKSLNLFVDINEVRRIDLIAELITKPDRRGFVYFPKLYLAISSKSILELSGNYKWVEKKGVSQCDIDLSFKTKKFDSKIIGYLKNDGTYVADIRVTYKFEARDEESIWFELRYTYYTDSEQVLTVNGNFQLQTTAYPNINFVTSMELQKSEDHFDGKIDFKSGPSKTDNKNKLMAQIVLTYYKSYNGLKLNTSVDIKKHSSDLNVKIGLNHKNGPGGSLSIFLLRYATGRNIIVTLDIKLPYLMINEYYDFMLNVTLPAVQQPMVVHVHIQEKYEKEYYVEFTGTWFSGHTAMAKGLFQDKSNHLSTLYVAKIQVRSRLFNEIHCSSNLTIIKNLEYDFRAMARQLHFLIYELSIMRENVDHNNITYFALLRHKLLPELIYQTFGEYIYNHTASYYFSNQVDFPKKEIITEIHINQYREIYVALRGVLQRWNTNFGFEVKWDVNRDPSQKVLFSITTNSYNISDGIAYTARSSFEYPGHISMCAWKAQASGNNYTMDTIFEITPLTAIELNTYFQNDFYSKGIVAIGSKLLTPFHNWKETSFQFGVYTNNQSFQTNGSLTWQGDQNMIFDMRGKYFVIDTYTSFWLVSSLNSTLQDLEALALNVNYRRIPNDIRLKMLLQPNPKYSISVITSGMVKYYADTTEYFYMLETETPFLEYSSTKLKSRLKLIGENLINGDVFLNVSDKQFSTQFKGIVRLFDDTKLCFRVRTPFERYTLINGKYSFLPSEKQISLVLSGPNMTVIGELIYIYNNITNFDLKLHLASPLSYISNVLLVAKFDGKSVDIRGGWNTFVVGISGTSYFRSWSDVEYSAQLFTPFASFKHPNAIFKVSASTPAEFVFKVHVSISDSTKVGIKIDYDSKKSLIVYRDECDNYEDTDSSGMVASTILKNAEVEIDTLLYPTLLAMFYIHQTGITYNLEAKLSLLLIRASLINNLTFENFLSLNNRMNLNSSIDMFSEISSTLTVEGMHGNTIDAALEYQLVSFNKTLDMNIHLNFNFTMNSFLLSCDKDLNELPPYNFYEILKGATDVHYKYEPLDDSDPSYKLRDIVMDGIYSVDVKSKTPFEHLEFCEIITTMRYQINFYEWKLNFNANNFNVIIVGNIQNTENFFNLLSSLNVTSQMVSVPLLSVQIKKDFIGLQREILFVLREGIPTGEKDIFSIGSSWYIDSKNFIYIQGDVTSPFAILDELRGRMRYSHEFEDEHVLEVYMKYSNKTELKSKIELRPPNVSLSLESTMEGLRNAHFVGSMQKLGGGKRRFDAYMVNDRSYRIQGVSSSTDHTPLSLEGKLLKGKEGIELSSVDIHLKKTKGGYFVLALLHSKGKTLDVETEIMDSYNNSKLINLQIRTSKGSTESLLVNAQLQLFHPEVYIFTVRGNSVLQDLHGTMTSEIKVWLKKDIKAIFTSLDSSILKGKAELFTCWQPPNIYYGSVKAFFVLQEVMSEVFATKFFTLKSQDLLANATAGVRIRINKKWSMESNLTSLVLSSQNVRLFAQHSLPDKNVHWISGKLFNLNDSHLIEHFLSYGSDKALTSPCYIIGNVDHLTSDLSGLVSFRCGIRQPIFLVDNFHGKKIASSVNLRNHLTSNTIKNNLLTKAIYDKINGYHNLRMKFFYPPKSLIATTNIDFESMNNFKCFLNTSTPYQNIPYFTTDIHAVTTWERYFRYSQVYFHDRPAIFNFTHTKKKQSNHVLNNGQIDLSFPITTWHEGNIIYVYRDYLARLNGSAEVKYNGERILDGNFTRNVTIASPFEMDLTHIDLGNFYIPVGINYFHKWNTSYGASTYDLKRTEIYKLENASSFNFTGEILMETTNIQEWTIVRVWNFNRSLTFTSFSNGDHVYRNDILALLGRNIYLGYGLKVAKQQTNASYDKVIDMNIAYPRRNFSLVNDVSYGDNYLTSNFTILNHLITPTKAVGITFNSKKLAYNHRQAHLILFHPSFIKNVTLSTSWYHSKVVLADVKCALEYSTRIDKKLTIVGSLEDLSPKVGHYYLLKLNTRHPSTKLKFDVSGLIKGESYVNIIANNISYTRSYLPNQYWNGRALLDRKSKTIEIERLQLGGMILMRGDYKKIKTVHYVSAMVIQDLTNISGIFSIDWYNKETYLLVNNTEDSSERIEMIGNMPENRLVRLDIWKTYADIAFPQISCYIGFNNSRLLTSAVMWRTDLGAVILAEIKSSISYFWTSAQESTEFWTLFLKSEAKDAIDDIWTDARPLVQNFIDDLHDVKTIQENINYFKVLFNDSYNANEFYLRDIHELYLLISNEVPLIHKIGSVPKILNEIWQSMGDTGKVMRSSIVWFVDTLKGVYDDLMKIINKLVNGEVEVYISKFLSTVTAKFDTFIKDMHISFISSAERAINEILSVLSHYWNKVLQIVEPTFIEVAHHLEATVWASSKRLIDYVYARREEFLNSPVYLRSANLTHQLDSIYKDLTRNDVSTNIKKYADIFSDGIYKYYISQIPFREELKSIGLEIIDEIKVLYELPLIAYTVDNIALTCDQVLWLYNYLDVSNLISKLIPFIYYRIRENFYTAMENDIRNVKFKTNFVFDPDNGIMQLEQNLPFPWHAFNETPLYDEISEVKTFRKYRDFLSNANAAFWQFYNSVLYLLHTSDWFPPFDGVAMIIGRKNFITFDGRNVEFNDMCAYLLTHDFRDDVFSIVANYDEDYANGHQSISLLIDEAVITIDLVHKSIRVNGNRQVEFFPTQINTTYITYDTEIVTIISEKGVIMECNVNYQICTILISGWYFGKLGGLLGTMNNEPSDDMSNFTELPNGMTKMQWSLNDAEGVDQCAKKEDTIMDYFDTEVDLCEKLFLNSTSVFESCFETVYSEPFYDMCIKSSTINQLCSFAMAYVQLCLTRNVPLRIPDSCVKCILNNGTVINEGQFDRMEGYSVPQSSDIVFIVEAKSCNKDILRKRNLMTLVTSLNKELQNDGMTRNRFALILFGGDGILEKPRYVTVNNDVFASNTTHFADYFDAMAKSEGKGTSDSSAALRHAAKLSFKGGASKTFILIPCSECESSSMSVGYEVLHQAMNEKSITLHVLINDEILVESAKPTKMFGLDREMVYTKSDFKMLKGDRDLRQNIKLSKSALGYCGHLALESNGSTFIASRLEAENLNDVKKFATTFAKRVAKSAHPPKCQNCECNGDSNGIPYIECIPCSYPTPINIDFIIDDEQFTRDFDLLQ